MFDFWSSILRVDRTQPLFSIVQEEVYTFGLIYLINFLVISILLRFWIKKLPTSIMRDVAIIVAVGILSDRVAGSIAGLATIVLCPVISGVASYLTLNRYLKNTWDIQNTRIWMISLTYSVLLNPFLLWLSIKLMHRYVF